MKYRPAPRSVGMRDRSRGKQLKVYHIGAKRTCMFAVENCLWYSGYRVCGDFALEMHFLLPPLDVTKNLWGEGGTFPQRY